MSSKIKNDFENYAMLLQKTTEVDLDVEDITRLLRSIISMTCVDLSTNEKSVNPLFTVVNKGDDEYYSLLSDNFKNMIKGNITTDIAEYEMEGN